MKKCIRLRLERDFGGSRIYLSNRSGYTIMNGWACVLKIV
jgi:hypothetical protein